MLYPSRLSAALVVLVFASSGCSEDGRDASPAAEGEGEGEGEGPGEGEGEGAAEGEGEGDPPPVRPVSPWDPMGVPGGVVTGLAVEEGDPAVLWAATRRKGLHRLALTDDPEWEQVPTPDEDLADVAIARGRVWIVLENDGAFSTDDGGETWAHVDDGYAVPVLPFAHALPRPIGRRLLASGDDLYLVANAGGLFRLRPDGAGWDALTTAASGVLSPAVDTAFVAADGALWLGCASLEAFVPPAFASAVSTVVYRSDDGGATWEPLDEGIDAHHVTAFAEADGHLLAATNGGGVYRLEGAAWVPLGDLPDPHVLGVWAIPEGGALIAGANGYIMTSEQDGRWIREVTGSLHAFSPPISAVFLPGEGAHAVIGLAGDGVFENPAVLGGPRADRGTPPRVEDGVVSVALSFHVNLYHSYRGDTADEDGFGKDIRVMRSILDMLDRHPEVRADWDFDNAFSLDDLLPRHAPDVLQRIVERVTRSDAPADAVRFMSWNNGMMGAETEDEVRRSVSKARDSYLATFGAGTAPGLQPQENMFSPDLVEILADEGIEWISLFYSATNFTGFRRDMALTPKQRYNVLTLGNGDQGDEAGATLKLLPVYHHADVVDHGGLRAWVSQIHRAMPNEDALLAIHFDADAESWLGFEREIEEVEAAADPHQAWTTMQDYYYYHSAWPAGDVVLSRDLADGVHDGYGSWAEKWINREVWTPIERARMDAAGAYNLLYYVAREDRQPVFTRLEEAADARLEALSTTHFGLANPALHPDREAAARVHAAEAMDLAHNALLQAASLVEEAQRPAGDVWLFHPGEEPFSGVARIPVEFAAGDQAADTLVARLHRVGDPDGARVPSELAWWDAHRDGSVAAGVVWANVELAPRELVGVTFESPGLPPTFGDDLVVRPDYLTNGLVRIDLSPEGVPTLAYIEHEPREVVPVGDEGYWWQPWLTWEGQRYAPERYDVEVTNSGRRGYLGQLALTGSVEVPGGGTWRIRYTLRVVRDQRFAFLDVETTWPGSHDAGGDPRLTEAVPVGLLPWLPERVLIDHDDDPETPDVCCNRDWLERHVVWRDTYRGTFGGFPVQEFRDVVNTAAAMGWAGVFTTLVAFDRYERSSPAFMPMRFQHGQGQDLRVLLAPFGTLDGDQPDPRPEKTGGSGLGARLTRMAAHMGPAAPSLAGRTERFSLALGGIPAVLGTRADRLSAKPADATRVAARAFATRPVVIPR